MITTTNIATRLTKKQASYLRCAAKVARRSAVRQRHGAVIVKSGSVISFGFNSYTNDPHLFSTELFALGKIAHLDRGRQLSTHAEIAALRRASAEQLRGATIYIARIAKNGERKNSAPCARCTIKLLAAGVKKIVFTE